MKEKTIEKIPYLGLKKISRIKSVKYIGVTAVKNIGHQRHLLLEVYENKKKSKKIPVVRIALTKKDFGTYWPDKQIWTRQQLSAYSPIWTNTHTYTAKILADENILQSPEDLARIKSFCGTEIYNDTRWWGHIAEYEGDITSKERTKRVERKYKRRQEALKDRQANTKELPEKSILYRADHVYFHDEHFLYYKKHGSWADIACSKCGGVTTAKWKYSGAYEEQFEKHIAEPREGDFGTCPMCGAHGQYKCKGKAKGSTRKTRYLFLGQKYKDDGFVMRYIQVEKEWTLGFIAGENDNEMYNAYEKLSGVELARAYFEPGKKVQVDYNKHDPYVGRDFWDDCNLYGLSSIRINSEPILPETYGELTGTMFQYSAMKEYTDSLMSVCNPVDGTNKAKTVVTNITKFSPKGLSDVRKTLTNNGKRVVDKLYLICNPSDEAEYVDPCMYGEALTGGYVNKSFIDIEKIVDANCPKGKAAFTIAGYYTMGTTGVRVNEYDQTKAMENADLIIASCYANGRAVDDNVAVIFDVTKLEEYVLPVTQATIVQAGQE